MLASALSLILLLLASPAPLEQTPLHEIGQDHAAAGACGPLVVHANAAIAAELRDRQWVIRTIARLRSVDLESVLSRRGALSDLTALSGELHENAQKGEDEMHRLAESGERVSEPAHRESLRTFSNALSAALAEELRTAVDLAAFTTYLEHIEIRGQTMDTPDLAHLAAADPLQHVATAPGAASGPLSSPYESAGTPNHMARAAAADFSARLTAIGSDESRAAERSEDAVTGCS